MRVLIVTAGSRGDVAPFTGLARRLEQAGHHVAVAAHGFFAGLVRGCGLDHRLLPGDPVEMARARIAAPSPDDARAVFSAFLEEVVEGLIEAIDAGADVVLSAFGMAPLSRVVAEAFGIPSIGTYLLPAVPTVHFPLPGWPEPGDLGPARNLSAGRELVGRAADLYDEVVPRLRAELGLPVATRPDRAAGSSPEGWPICHGFSTVVVPRPDDWPPEVCVSGYWWPARPTGWQPEGDLLDFLDAGPAPVFVGFGSMAVPRAEWLTELVSDALQRAQVRAVVQGGWAGLTPVGDDIMLIGEVPYDWLFPQMAVVVHHAGAGTTGAGLRAGVPAVAVPVVIDQPFWAGRLHHLGVAPAPLPHDELTVDALAMAIRSCLDEPAYRSRATEIANRVRTEDGAAAVLAVINTLAQ
jgi:sterol 3beta-glucosyltransferase